MKSICLATLRGYFTLVYIVVLATLALFAQALPPAPLPVQVFMLVAVIVYPLVYMTPAILLPILIVLAGSCARPWRCRIALAIAWLGGAMLLVFLYADYRLYQLYEYHFNAFVWNIITTRGGIASLGATAASMRTFALDISIVLIVNTLLLWLAHKNYFNWLRHFSPRRCGIAIIILGTLLLVEEGTAAWYQYVEDGAGCAVIALVPLHLKTTASGLLQRLGVAKPQHKRITISRGHMHYPLAPLQRTRPHHPPNIIWLVAESFRADLIDPKITPNLWRYKQQALYFTNHYSGGNRTRMGLLSMFYGLYPPYWYHLQQEKVRPLIMDLLMADNYQLSLNTSQSFTYPELNDTLFTRIPNTCKQELRNGPPWQRDRDNTSHIINFIAGRQRQRPFFVFMFYESTHASYSFPPATAIRANYSKKVNYARLASKLGNIQPLHNRYINAAHYVDGQVGRLLDYLRRNHLFDNTIVLFTGDHGEEFMERGAWGHGHNISFTRYCTQVPLLLWLPGQPGRTIAHITSHNQIPATLLPMLGVENDARDYSSATSLLTGPPAYVVIGSHDSIAVRANATIAWPFTSSQYFHYVVRDRDDYVVARARKEELLRQYQPQINEVIKECGRFLQ